jgi:hypothetical protein
MSTEERTRFDHPGERRYDKRRGDRFVIHARENWYRDVWLFIITGVVLFAVLTASQAGHDAVRASNDAKALAVSNRALIDRIEKDRNARRNDTCVTAERQEATSVKAVIRTYAFLRTLPRSERGTAITRAIVRNLPMTYANAKADRAPKYCDEPGVGLPEPGPRLPQPRSFKYLLKR